MYTSKTKPPYKVINTIEFSADTGTLPVFTVTGNVRVRVIPICKTSLASASGARVSLGVSTSVAAMIASTTATDIDDNEIWIDASPDTKIENEATALNFTIGGGLDILLTIADTIDSGRIAFYCAWKPLSIGALVVPA